MDLSVIGAGYVGLVTAACLSEIGHRVICMDHDAEKMAVLEAGKMPIYEPHLEELIRSNRQKGRLFFTMDLCQAARDSQVIFICVGTPPLENGEADLSAVEKVTRQVARLHIPTNW